VTAKAKVTNFKKGIPCIWYWGTTQITWNNFSCDFGIQFDNLYFDHQWTGPDKSEHDYVIHREKAIDEFFGEPGEGYPYWDSEWRKIKSDFYTPAIGWWYFYWIL